MVKVLGSCCSVEEEGGVCQCVVLSSSAGIGGGGGAHLLRHRCLCRGERCYITIMSRDISMMFTRLLIIYATVTWMEQQTESLCKFVSFFIITNGQVMCIYIYFMHTGGTLDKK